jgi:hypothetical protein
MARGLGEGSTGEAEEEGETEVESIHWMRKRHNEPAKFSLLEAALD